MNNKSDGTLPASLWTIVKEGMPLIAAIIGFVGGVIIGEARYKSDVQLQNQRYLLDQQKAAYMNFFEGQAKLKEARELQDAGKKERAEELLEEYRLKVKTSNFQIAIFSTKPVVEALAKYYRTFNYPPCSKNSQIKTDIAIYQSMRQEVFELNANQRVSDNDLATLIFSCTLPEN